MDRLIMPTDVSRQTITKGKWLCYKHVQFTDPVHARKHNWEYVQRVKPTPDEPSAVDAVEVVALLKQGGETFIILVMQYRPPIDKYCLEFPAGLVDAGESVHDAAVRELKEETGYQVSSIISTTPPLYFETGLSDSSMRQVFVQVQDDTLPQQQSLEQDEWSLKTVMLPLDGLRGSLDLMHSQDNVAIDANLYNFAVGRDSLNFI